MMAFDRLRAWPRKYLWQAPRGWFLKLTRNSDARMRAIIAGKSVAVVGNAQSLLGSRFGAEIEAHDVVIRLNKGFVVDPLAQGRRTDIVSLTPELTEAEIVAEFDPTLICVLTPKLRHLHLTSADLLRRAVFYPARYWAADRNRIGRRPSSGYMMTSFLLRVGGAKSITLYGFDFGATATYYNPPGYQTPHDFSAEAALITDWAREGRIAIVTA